MAHRVFITGAAGYLGGILCDLLSLRDDVECIVALDKQPMPRRLDGNAKIRWITANTADVSWRGIVEGERPDIVIHAAWQIREIYGRPALQHEWNVTGSANVFDFAFATASVKRLLHLSTVAAYGAQADNAIDRRFTEQDALRSSDMRYAEEKRLVEERLARQFDGAREKNREIMVAVLRPVAVTGPRGRIQPGYFRLQTALSGQAKGHASHRIASTLLSVLPVTPNWSRQFIHEDDFADVAALLAFGEMKDKYTVLNAAPPGAVVRGPDMAQAFGKRTIAVHPQLIRLAFWLAWHATQGRISTSRGAWKSYCYPIAVDGAKLTAMYDYRYRMSAKDALTTQGGRYAGFSP
jgi:nucleoside-diphosphate-sugar epimerase